LRGVVDYGVVAWNSGIAMNYWEVFWTVCLLGAGGAFTFITIVVIVKGGPDLREMLKQLRRQSLQK
jgi:hypothetical protein